MKKLLLPFILVAFLLQSCDNGIVRDNPEPSGKLPRTLTSSERVLVSHANTFSYDIFRHVVAADPQKNVFISPLSISMALGMTLNGAAGNTATGIKKTLDMNGMTLHEINKSYKSLIKLLLNLDPKVKINIANSLWSRKGFPIEQSFKDTLQTYFNAQSQALDFDDPATIGIINHWVEKQTHGRIKKIISGISPLTVLYLMNAVYFKGNWRYKFDKDETNPAPFHLENGSTVNVEMMHRKAPLAVFRSDKVKMAQLAYGDSLYVMTILTPANPNTPIHQFVKHSLTSDNVSRWSDELRPQVDMTLELPKFKASYKKTLNDILKAMGMKQAFTGMANFSRINPNAPLVISQVLHKANITVNEKGSEAAAVTSVGFELVSFHGFIVNHPFVYLIRERTSGTILFMGVMRNPG